MKMRSKLIQLFLFVFYFYADIIVFSDGNQEVELFNELFRRRNYSSLVRPVLNTSHAVDVEIDVALVQLVALDDREQSMTTNIWVRHFWSNQYLTWNPKEFGGLTSLIVDKKWIWTPDIVLYNSAESRLNGQLDQHKTRIILSHNGRNTWYIPSIMISGCSIDIRYFPFDYQTCSLTFMSWTYLRHELNLINTRKVMDTTSYLTSSDFALIDTKAKRTEMVYSISPNPFVDITYTVLLRREPGFYIFNAILPSLALTFFAMITFAHPDEIGERMGLAIECFLTISILMNMVSDSIPIDSNVTPLLMRFQLICMIAMTMTIFMNALCFNMIGTTAMPWWLHDIVFNKLAPYVMWESCMRAVKEKGSCSTTALCEGLFAASLNDRFDDTKDDNEHNGELRVQLSSKLWNPLITSQKDIQGNTRHQTPRFTKMEDLQKLTNNDVKNIKVLARKAIDEMEGENTAEVWRCISQTVDRLMLLIFIIVYVTINVALLLQVPKVNLN